MANFRLPVYSGLLLLQAFLLFACNTAYRAPVSDITGGPRYVTDGRMHRVNAGETLYVVAWLYDLDYQLLAQVNELSPPYTLQIGQMLRVDLRGETLRPTVTTTAAVATPAITSRPVPATPLPGPATADETSTPLPNPTVEPAASTESTQPVESAENSQAVAEASTTSPPATITEPPTGKPELEVPVPKPQDPKPAETNEAPQPLPDKELAQDMPAWIWPAQGELVGRFSTSGTENKGIDISGQPGDPVLASGAGEVVYAGGGLLHYGEMIIIKHDNRYLSAYAHNRRLLVTEGEQVTQGQKIAELGSTGIERNILHFEIREEGRPVDPLRFLPAR